MQRLSRFLPHFLGLCLLFFAFFLTAALLSYNPLDASFNRSSEGAVTNMAGPAGAFIADPLLQFLGLASLVLLIIPLFLGVQLMIGRKISWWVLRFASLCFALIATATLLATIDSPEKWPFSSLGGFIGAFTESKLLHYIPRLGITGMSIVLVAITFFFASGFTLSEWKKGFKVAARWFAVTVYTVKKTAVMLFNAVSWIYCFFRGRAYEPVRIEEPDYLSAGEEDEEEAVTLKEMSAERSEPKVAAKVLAPAVTSSKRVKQRSFSLPHGKYELPDLAFLNLPSEKQKKQAISESALSQNARLLEKVLEDFGIYGQITQIRPGPVVTLYELEPAAGTKSSRVIGLADDIARSMSAVSARIAVIPGRNAIGIELPNSTREIVYLRELIENDEYRNEDVRLPIALGKNIGGESVIVDLTRMPHLLVAGTTGSGKSVAINTMILSFLYRLTPDQCKFIMIDPKMLELSVYDGIPHLLAPVVTEPSKAVTALKWTVKEMENRYRLMSNLGVRNIGGYNKRIEEAKARGEQLERTVQTGFEQGTGKPIIEKVPLDMVPLPFIVVVVDEMADLMLVAGKEIESSIQRLAQMARAAGIHLIMATQRPSVDVITGVIKANFPTRISFQVTSRIDSRTILGEQGAEQLLGMGDMLYMAGGSRITRVHAPFVDDREVEKIVSFLKTQSAPSYIEDITKEEEEEGSYEESGEADSLYDEAVAIVARDRKVSTSYIQRCLRIGYNRAASIVERMEREGVISRANHVGKREVLIPEQEAAS